MHDDGEQRGDGDQFGSWRSTQQLLVAARRHGFLEVTPRLLETWRHEGLVLRPRRIGQNGRQPVWLSPPETEQQLLTLCRLREWTRDIPTLRIQLWLRGYDQPLPEIRAALHAVLDHLAETLAQTGHGELDRLGARLAAARPEHPVPPRVRSARPYRQPAVWALLAVFATGAPAPAGGATGEDVERGLGLLPRGRLDRLDHRSGGIDPPVGPWHDGQPLDLSALAAIGSRPALNRAIDLASDQDILVARTAAVPLTEGLATLARAAGAFYGDTFLGFTALRRCADSVYAEPVAVALVMSLQQHGLGENLNGFIGAINEAWRQLRSIFTTLQRLPDERLDGPEDVKRLAAEFNLRGNNTGKDQT